MSETDDERENEPTRNVNAWRTPGRAYEREAVTMAESDAGRTESTRTGASGGDHAGTAEAGEPESVPDPSNTKPSTDLVGETRPAVIASRQAPFAGPVRFEAGDVIVEYSMTPPLAVDSLVKHHGFLLGASSDGPYVYTSSENVADNGEVTR